MFYLGTSWSQPKCRRPKRRGWRCRRAMSPCSSSFWATRTCARRGSARWSSGRGSGWTAPARAVPLVARPTPIALTRTRDFHRFHNGNFTFVYLIFQCWRYVFSLWMIAFQKYISKSRVLWYIKWNWHCQSYLHKYLS